MGQLILPESKKVLAFNPARILVGVFRSVRAAAEMSGGSAQGVSNASVGRSATSVGYYWRHEHEDVEIEIIDIGELRLEEYDKLCGSKREYISSRDIRGKRILGLKNKSLMRYGTRKSKK